MQATVRRELKDASLLRDLAARSIGSGDPSVLFEELLAGAIEITEADAGTIQLSRTGYWHADLLGIKGL